jgi:hypothetical protein
MAGHVAVCGCPAECGRVRQGAWQCAAVRVAVCGSVGSVRQCMAVGTVVCAQRVQYARQCAAVQLVVCWSVAARVWQCGIIIIIIVTQGWVANGVRRHAEPLGDNDPPQLLVSLSQCDSAAVRQCESVHGTVCGSMWQCVRQCVAERLVVCGSRAAVRVRQCGSLRQCGSGWQCALHGSAQQCAAVYGSARGSSVS